MNHPHQGATWALPCPKRSYFFIFSGIVSFSLLVTLLYNISPVQPFSSNDPSSPNDDIRKTIQLERSLSSNALVFSNSTMELMVQNPNPILLWWHPLLAENSVWIYIHIHIYMYIQNEQCLLPCMNMLTLADLGGKSWESWGWGGVGLGRGVGRLQDPRIGAITLLTFPPSSSSLKCSPVFAQWNVIKDLVELLTTDRSLIGPVRQHHATHYISSTAQYTHAQAHTTLHAHIYIYIHTYTHTHTHSLTRLLTHTHFHTHSHSHSLFSLTSYTNTTAYIYIYIYIAACLFSFP